MLYSKLSNKPKSIGSTKMAVVSCALFGNALLSGCAHNSSMQMMKLVETSKLELNSEETGRGGDNETYRTEKNSCEKSIRNSTRKSKSKPAAPADTKSSWKKWFIAGIAGLLAINIGVSTAFGVVKTDDNHTIDDLNHQIAYLEEQNQYLNYNLTATSSELVKNQNYLSGNVTLLGQTQSQLTQTQTGLSTTQAGLAATQVQLTESETNATTLANQLNDTRIVLESTRNPDHFVTLSAGVVVDNATINLNYLNYINYVGTNDKVEFTVDQTSLSDLNSLNLVASLLQPEGPVVFNLLETYMSICAGNTLDLSGFTLASSITLNGPLYVGVVGPINKDALTNSTTSITDSIYDYSNNYFTINSPVCGGSRSTLLSSDNPPVYLSGTDPVVIKLNSGYNMVMSDLEACFTNNQYNLLDSNTGFFNSTGFLGDGTTPIPGVGTLLVINNLVINSSLKYPSNSMIYDIVSQMHNLKYLFMNAVPVSGAQLSKSLTNLDDQGDYACIQESDIVGNVNVPVNVILSCSIFMNSSNTNWASDPRFLSGSQLNIGLFIVTQSSASDTPALRVPIPSGSTGLTFYANTLSYSGINVNSGFIWSNGTSFGSGYEPIGTGYIWGTGGYTGGQPLEYLGDCSTTA